MSRKSERLVNLVIALLATKRNVTKSEIFRTIEGYEGSNDSMERMFERDKDELRSLGIEIEVSGLDPLFDDEVGYRIRPENFSFDSEGFSPVQIAYMSLAAQLWKDASLSEVSQKAVRKLAGFASSMDIDDIPAVAPLALSAPIFLDEIVNCISERKPIEFAYLDHELNSHLRNVHVYSYFSLNGFWYFRGFDTEKMDIRTFRCDRIQGELIISKKSNSYQIPENFKTDLSFNDFTPDKNAILRIRKGRGAQIKILASSSINDGDFDSVQINYSSQIPLVELILWHLDDVEVIEPMILRNEIVKSLENLVTCHG